MPVNYNRTEWLADLFPEGGAPRQMSTEQWEELVFKHKELLKLREIEQARISELKQREFEETLKIKDAIAYSDKLAEEICERISAGELLINICNDHHMPTIKRVNQYLKSNNDFMQLYQQAHQDRLNIFEEEIISIADDVSGDFKEVTVKRVTKRVVDPEVIARAKLRIEVRLRHLKSGRPSKWSDQSTLNVKNENADDPESMTNEEIERRIAEIENKEKIVRFPK